MYFGGRSLQFYCAWLLCDLSASWHNPEERNSLNAGNVEHQQSRLHCRFVR